jgi:hypothetical protein
MSEVELVEKLAHALAGRLQPAIPLSIDLWDTATIGQFLKREAQQVRERIVCLPDFPKAIRLPSAKGRAQPLWKAAEVIAWAERYQEKQTRK